ncbi:hypothetical protein LTR62_003294 [Meristemomyces frigidus]|uniref:Uncharacterized protein n=1 Tax=Meristemomyces frigidus TaxID=1508187 RepID=A0AAN7TKZ5_9PEZI|nr:hypothetical protein LTR62_003294 [Meristemomyces frigidus]
MALVTTFITTPMTAWVYPNWYQQKLELWKRGEIDWATGAPPSDGSLNISVVAVKDLEAKKISGLLVYLRLDTMATSLAFVSLLGGKPSDSTVRLHPSRPDETATDQSRIPGIKRPLRAHGVRLLELTTRTSAAMRATVVDDLTIGDPVITAFKVLGQLYQLAVSGEATVVPEASYADSLTNKATEESLDLLLIPWTETGGMSEAQVSSTDGMQAKLASDAYAAFLTKALERARCMTAVFVNNGFTGTVNQIPMERRRSMSVISLRDPQGHVIQHPVVNQTHHIFLPFFGGADGRAAVRLVLQLAENPMVTATILFLSDGNRSSSLRGASVVSVQQTTVMMTDKDEPGSTDPQRWPDDATFFATMQAELPADLRDRVVMDDLTTVTPLQDAVARAQAELGQDLKNSKDILVLGRSSAELKGYSNAGGSQHCLGLVAIKMVGERCQGEFACCAGWKGGNINDPHDISTCMAVLLRSLRPNRSDLRYAVPPVKEPRAKSRSGQVLGPSFAYSTFFLANYTLRQRSE